jgi:hypothetical protein
MTVGGVQNRRCTCVATRRARQWMREQSKDRAALVATFKKKMLAIGMKP